ncbi:TPR domain protein [Xylaria digitata]|nr:TPR domain protein [Xylaria digitata]
MPLIYGEGQKHACKRLQKELKSNLYYKTRNITTDFWIGYQKQQREPFSTINEKCDGPATRVALIGIGGIGKSQAVIEYAYRVRVHASTAARVKEAYRGIADRLSLPGQHDPNANVCQLVLILDNADDTETFFPQQKPHNASTPLGNHLPQSPNGSIVVTSQNKDAAVRIVGDLRNVMQVRAIGKSQALQLLRNRLDTTSSEDGITKLLDALNYIPLAITQAAAYINRQPRITVLSYLDKFRRSAQRKKKLLHRNSGNLRRNGSASNSMLRKYYKTTMSNNKKDTDGKFNDDIDLLQALSFVTTAVNKDWLRSRCEKEIWKRRFLSLIATEFPTGKFQNRAKSQNAAVKAFKIKKRISQFYNMSTLTTAAILASVLRGQGKYNKAEKINQRTVEGYENVLGKQHPDTLTSYEEAELGAQHPDTLTSMSNLALVLRNERKYDEAEMLNRQALKKKKEVLEKHHPSTLTAASNLALVLHEQKKYNKSESLNRQALNSREAELEKQHPHTLISISNLAVNNLSLALLDQQKYAEAERLSRRAVQGYHTKLGAQHPHTLTSLNNLASILQHQEKYEEAETTNRRVLGAYEKRLGIEHPNTLKSRKYKEAKQLNRRALERREKQLGMQHPDTIKSAGNLVSVLQDQGNYNKAAKLKRYG